MWVFEAVPGSIWVQNVALSQFTQRDLNLTLRPGILPT